MLPGVEILAQEEITVSYAMNWQVAIIIGIITFIVVIVLAVLGLEPSSWGEVLGVFMISFISAGFMASLLGHGSGAPTKYETEYKVTISPEVSFEEFNEKYRIIDQEGKIYTIRERLE